MWNAHAPVKKKVVRGNKAPFMNKTLSKAFMTRARLKRISNIRPTEENVEAFKRYRNFCVSLLRKEKKLDSCMSGIFPPHVPHPACATAYMCHTLYVPRPSSQKNQVTLKFKFKFKFKFNSSSSSSSSSIKVQFKLKFKFNSN